MSSQELINVYTFSNQPPVDLKKVQTNKLGSAKVNTAFIMQAQSEADIDGFFKHKKFREDPALSDQEKLMSGTKSLLLSCLPVMVDPGLFQQSSRPLLLCVICWPSFIRSNPTRSVYLLRLHTEAISTIPADSDDKQHYKNSAGWDTYQDEGLKSQTRAKRGATISQRTKVSTNTPRAP
jgi:hypothetical protein